MIKKRSEQRESANETTSLGGIRVWPPRDGVRRIARPLLRLATGMLAATLLGSPSAFRAAAAEPAKPDRGYTYFHDEVPQKPWSIHVVKVDLAHQGLRLCTTLGNGTAIGKSTVSQQVRAMPRDMGQPVAAVNGDFYSRSRRYVGLPRGLQIRQGEVITTPGEHWVFYVDPAGRPRMTNVQSRFRLVWANGTVTPFQLNTDRTPEEAVLFTAAVGVSTHTAGGVELVLQNATNTAPWLPLQLGTTYLAQVREVRNTGDTRLNSNLPVLSLGARLAAQLPPIRVGQTLKIVTDTTPNLAGVTAALGGNPTLVEDGRAMEWSGLQPRHPRTAVGWNKDYLFLVEVDGRQPSLSVGMTFPELAEYMIKLGCEQALNLDGGGSSTMWVNGVVMNSPSLGDERPAANALVLVNTKAARH